MELLDLTVPKDMCMLDFLATEKRCKNAWIIVHEILVRELTESKGVVSSDGVFGFKILEWETTEEYQAKKFVCSRLWARGWYLIISIDADDIPFKEIHDIEEPEYVIRLKAA